MAFCQAARAREQAFSSAASTRTLRAGVEAADEGARQLAEEVCPNGQ